MTSSDYQELVRFLTSKFDRNDARFEGLEGRFDVPEGRFQGLEGRISGLETRIEGLKDRFSGLENRFQAVERRLTRVEVSLEEHKTLIQIVAEGVTTVDTKLDRFKEDVAEEFRALRAEFA